VVGRWVWSDLKKNKTKRFVRKGMFGGKNEKIKIKLC
jgi:hypothetical protein